MAKAAIYTRKSVYGEDSISIETQIEICEKELKVRNIEYIKTTDSVARILKDLISNVLCLILTQVKSTRS